MKRRMNPRLRKKGAITDIFVFIVLAFILAVMLPLYLYIANTTEAKFIEVSSSVQKGLDPSNNFTEVMGDTFGAVPRAYQSFKWITVMLIVGMAIGVIVSGFLIRINKAFFILYVLIMIVAVTVAAVVSNAYETLSQEPTLAATFVQFSAQNHIMSNLPIWVTIIGFVAGIVMFVGLIRPREELF